MAAAKSSSGRRPAGTPGVRGSRNAKPGAKTPVTKAQSAKKPVATATPTTGAEPRNTGVTDDLANFAEDVANRLMKPLDAVLLTRERIQATFDEAVERGRMTRSDANELIAALVRRGRQQTDELLDRARRTVGAGPPFPIDEYDELTVAQVDRQLPGLSPPQLRRIRDYERSHANRKSVLAKVENLLG
jgi:hypothetical protein